MSGDLPHYGLKRAHRFTDFLYWNLLMAVPLVTAAIGIGLRSSVALFIYVVVIVLCLVLIYRHFCTHCPHYHAGRRVVRCMFFWGMPKLFPSKEGPLSGRDKLITAAAAAILIVFPINWLADDIGLLVIYLMTLTVFGLTIRRHECGRCIYSDCPLNAAAGGGE